MQQIDKKIQKDPKIKATVDDIIKTFVIDDKSIISLSYLLFLLAS